ncbi:MAG: hypothetical protein SFY70_10280 [Bacteroidia bacterium]|nr:hypothetical protein [Bacteroidia bacterium]
MELTLTLTEETVNWLRSKAQAQNTTLEVYLKGHFEKLAALEAIKDNRGQLQVYARKAGITSEEDIYRTIS